MSTEPLLSFFVSGTPSTQGSKVSFVSKHARRRDGKHFVVTKDDNRKLQNWRSSVAWHARQAGARVLAGPLALELTFVMPRPKAHHVAGDYARPVRQGMPVWVDKKPDSVKLARAVEDALSGVCWNDDAQVVRHVIVKRYREHGEVCGVLVSVSKP